jgi:hypothetical protein
MDIKTKQEKLKEIHDDFEIKARPFKSGAVCTKGCAFCCIHFGNVDAITLEGLIIHEWIETKFSGPCFAGPCFDCRLVERPKNNFSLDKFLCVE